MANDPDRPTVEIVEALRGVLSRVAEPNAVLESILQQAVDRTTADRGLIVEVLDDGALEYRVMKGFRASHFQGDAGAFSRSIFHRVVESGEDVILDRAAADPYWKEIQSVQSLNTAAILCMPIWIGDRVAGIVHLENRRPGHFGAQHRQVLRSLLAVAGPVLQTLRVGREVLEERDSLRQQTDTLREETDESRALLAREWTFGRFIGRTAAVRELEASIRKAAGSERPALLVGETGTGKSFVARVLHNASPRKEGPFVTAACPNLGKDIMESALFGHCKGAFTSAVADRTGKVQAADGGTLFLDEIGELPLEIQSRLLRFLDREGTYERVGESQERTANVRVVAATNRDLGDMVRQGLFRLDLLQRLDFHPIRLPALRERRDDIPLLLRYFLDRTESGRWIEMSPEADTFLVRHEHPWPGNVREVDKLAARMAAEGHSGPFTPQDVERLLDPGGARPAGGAPVAARVEAPDWGLNAHMEEAEREYLVEFLSTHSHLTRAEQARTLKIGEASLFAKLRKHGIRG